MFLVYISGAAVGTVFTRNEEGQEKRRTRRRQSQACREGWSLSTFRVKTSDFIGIYHDGRAKRCRPRRAFPATPADVPQGLTRHAEEYHGISSGHKSGVGSTKWVSGPTWMRTGYFGLVSSAFRWQREQQQAFTKTRTEI